MIAQKKHVPKDPGFALVATLTLMVLLSLLALGMLSLSSVSLRASSQGDAIAVARANARLALMVAIGELQKEMGPDRRISATSEILAAPPTAITKPNTTGVWESWWDFDPNASPDYAAEKTSRFRRWLVSSADADATGSLDFVTTAWTGKTIELVGAGSLGPGATAAEKVTAGLVPVSEDGKTLGSYAWHVSDESVKARINLYRDPGQNTTLADKRALLAGHRPDPSVMEAADGSSLDFLPTDLDPAGFADATAKSGKIINLNQAELLEGAEGKIKPFRNHITPYSLGVLADVRGGGLKQDLSSMFEMGDAFANTLPSDFTNAKLYESTHGITGVSDPYWSALAGYYNSFRSLTNPETSPALAVKSSDTFADPVPEGYNPAPVIAKVDTIFSLVCRPLNEIHWLGTSTKGQFEYFVGLIFTPVVTLHNPYNVNVSFHKMEVSFENIPIAFNFMLDEGSGFRSQSVVPGTFESINTMAYSHAGHRDNKLFKITIADWSDPKILASSSAINGPITLKPGQSLVCGPILPPDASLKKDSKLGSNTIGFDWENDLTEAVKAIPAYTPGIGFEIYGVTIGHTWRYGEDFKGSWVTFNFLADQAVDPAATNTTRFYVDFKFQQPSWYLGDLAKTTATLNKAFADPSFAVTARIQPTAADPPVDFAKLKFDYQDDTTLANALGDRVYRYPPTDALYGRDASAPSGVPYSEQATFIHPFAIFSVYSRTTNGGVYETGSRTKGGIDSPQLNLLKDGRLAGKPFLFHNPSRSNFTMNLATEKPGVQAHEINFQPFLSKGDYEDYMDVDINRVPSLTGNKTSTGVKSGSYLEIPSGPLQTIADFRRSNALTTSYLPYFVQPVGNSLLHPLMSANRVAESNPDIAPNTLLDHSVLANHALYDRFYFSTFATRGSTTPDSVFEQFMDGTAPLASQAFEPYLLGGKTLAEAKADLFDSGMPRDTAYKTAAEYQMIRGSFNVNSTSVQAWKAVLAAMNKTDVATLWARTAGLETETSDGIPIPGMSMLNGGASGNAAVDSTKIDNVRTNDWNGYRELNETELETLAEKIVEEVRARGPFLSMSEFVNRQVGTVGPRTLRGALEAAIAESEINEGQDGVFPDTYLDQVPITPTDVSDPALYDYTTPEATTGNPAAGAPGWVSQGDLLRILEPAATVRGDTFVIRVYGEALDTGGKVIAHAYAEAVVQRVPEYLDPADRPSANPYSDPSAAEANKVFGRRIDMVSFRWLSDDEI